MKALYDEDFVEWTAANAELLRSGQISEADIQHIAEEIEDMGKNRRTALTSHLRILQAHLLKHQFQPALRGPSWLQTILNARDTIGEILEESPSLRSRLPEMIAKTYPKAIRLAA